MTIIFPDQGEAILLSYLVGADTPEDLVLRLFANDVTDGLSPAQIEALTEADFTEADFTGYQAITLSGASWTVTPGDPTEATYAQQSFTSSADQSPQTIYGYYLTRDSSGDLVAFEYFATPVVVEFEDDTIKVTPKITAQDAQD